MPIISDSGVYETISEWIASGDKEGFIEDSKKEDQ